MDLQYKKHYSVLFKEVIELLLQLNLNKNTFAIDGTFGAGGHSFEIFSHIKEGILFSFDQDSDAYNNGKSEIQKKLSDSKKLVLINDNFENFDSHLFEYKNKIDFILLDIGVSSHHFDSGERGFSFRFDGPLDMRMNTNANVDTAHTIINTYTEQQLEEIFRVYGEEKFARRIARDICSQRNEKEINTTFELAALIKQSYPAKLRFGKINPATKVFQALRIVINNELGVLENSIPKMYDYLSDDGMLVIITFHSLEDRIVKHCFKKLFIEFPDKCTILSKKPILPSEDEISINPRSRSAKMRVLKKAMEELSEKKKKYSKFKNKSNQQYT